MSRVMSHLMKMRYLFGCAPRPRIPAVDKVAKVINVIIVPTNQRRERATIRPMRQPPPAHAVVRLVTDHVSVNLPRNNSNRPMGVEIISGSIEIVTIDQKQTIEEERNRARRPRDHGNMMIAPERHTDSRKKTRKIRN